MKKILVTMIAAAFAMTSVAFAAQNSVPASSTHAKTVVEKKAKKKKKTKKSKKGKKAEKPAEEKAAEKPAEGAGAAPAGGEAPKSE